MNFPKVGLLFIYCSLPLITILSFSDFKIKTVKICVLFRCCILVSTINIFILVIARQLWRMPLVVQLCLKMYFRYLFCLMNCRKYLCLLFRISYCIFFLSWNCALWLFLEGFNLTWSIFHWHSLFCVVFS